MSESKNKRRGRPKIEPDKEEVERIFALFAPTRAELAAYFYISRNVVERWAKEPWFKAAEEAAPHRVRALLKQKQIEVALKGNTAMLIWLGKNLLGQRERPEELEAVDELVKKFAAAVQEMKAATHVSETNGHVGHPPLVSS